MTENSYKAIGLMSGTSLDGLDMAHCTFHLIDGRWQFRLDHFESLPYSEEMMRSLKDCISLPADELLAFNIEYGKWLGMHVLDFVQKHDLKPDFVSSHGHTVFHQADKGFTYQIGAGQEIANNSGLQVICDFRSLDVSLGGQGAPLVPIGDKYLFSDYDFCLNIGGISNVSFDQQGQRVAYDISIANMLLNYLSQQLGHPFDWGGQMARSGKSDQSLLDALDNLPYYHQSFPKSIGYEWFIEAVKPIVDEATISIEDKLHSCVCHIVKQIAENILTHASPGQKMLVTGGGARNDFLIERITSALNGKVEVCIPNAEIIDFKEAIVFAFMGVLRVRGEVNCLKSVTGAKKDSSGGVIFHPH